MVNILLLLAEEVRTDAVKRIAAELVVALQDLPDIKDDSALGGDGLGLALSKGF